MTEFSAQVLNYLKRFANFIALRYGLDGDVLEQESAISLWKLRKKYNAQRANGRNREAWMMIMVPRVVRRRANQLLNGARRQPRTATTGEVEAGLFDSLPARPDMIRDEVEGIDEWFRSESPTWASQLGELRELGRRFHAQGDIRLAERCARRAGLWHTCLDWGRKSYIPLLYSKGQLSAREIATLGNTTVPAVHTACSRFRGRIRARSRQELELMKGER